MAKPVCARTNVGVGAVDRARADEGRDLRGVDPVAAGGHHQQRGSVGGEHQRVGDLGDLDPELRRGLGGGAGGVVEGPDLAVDAQLGQPAR